MQNLKIIQTILQTQNICEIYICLDYLGVTQNTGLVPHRSSQGIFQQFEYFAKK